MFCLVWDVCTNGYIKTNLESLGWFLVGIGIYMAGGSVPKTISDISNKKKGTYIRSNTKRINNEKKSDT